MKKYGKYIGLLIIQFFLVKATAFCQPAAVPDSLFFRLKKIKSQTDSVNIGYVFEQLYKSSDAALLNYGDSVMTEIDKLRATLSEKDYFDLAANYANRLFNAAAPALKEEGIRIIQQWLARNEHVKSGYGYYSFLETLRELRIPLRSLGKLNELTEYFSAEEKKYLAVNDSNAVSVADNVLSGNYFRLGLIEKAKYYQLKSISFLNDKQEYYGKYASAVMFGKAGKVNRYAVLSSYYITNNKPGIAENYLKEAIRYYHQLDSPMLMLDAPFLFLQMARCKTLQKKENSASYYDTALNYLQLYQVQPLEYAHYYQEKAVDFISKNLLDAALVSITRSQKIKDSFRLGMISYFGDLLPAFHKATVLIKKGDAKDAIPLLQNEIKEVRQFNNYNILISELNLLAQAYSAAGNSSEAYKTLNEAFTLKEKIVADADDARSLNFETEKKMQENENAIFLLNTQNKSNKKIKYYLIGIVSLLGLLAIGLGVFYFNKRKTNRQLSLKNEKLGHTLAKLQATQSQLIQSEKMASLGELTAGIAHEIQNPLNFVNNFSEVSTELIKEMVDEVDRGNTEEVKAIANDLVQNLEKINYHGKRADGIVKGMLQHSRSSNGQKEMTDINVLCDEYLRLAYHGLRAKDKSFNAALKTDFDESIGKINIVPQDTGRVILNLITNAFYVVDEKKKSGITDYAPTVWVSTKKRGDKVEIKVADNGNGISKKIMDKIFQPFFTTKPTGQGTGLGLSLSYDIITKGHGGELKVETKEGEGTAFIILLPMA
jgi:signal transduction histidine kinase